MSTAELYGIINHLFDTEHGGQWSASDPGRIYVFGDEESGSVFGRMVAMGNPFDFGSEGRESGHNGVWSSSGGFYDKGLYPEDAKWVKLNEVVINGIYKNKTGYPNKKYNDDVLLQNGNFFDQQLVYSLKEFWEQNHGKSYIQIITQQPWKDKMPGGPTLRYVRNPVDGKVMDMRHVMVVGYAGGSYIGTGVEILQWFGPIIGKSETRESAFNEQDFYSNDIGANFFTHNLFSWSFNKDWSTEFYNWLLKSKN